MPIPNHLRPTVRIPSPRPKVWPWAMRKPVYYSQYPTSKGMRRF